MLELIVGILLAVWVIIILFMYRNQQVFKERNRVRRLIFAQDEDGNYIRSTAEVLRLMQLYDAVSYDEMYKKFWIPVEDFYKDLKEMLEDNMENESK